MNFREALKSQILVLDGAMGTMTQALDLTDKDFGGGDFRMLGDLLSFSNPDAIEGIHLRYFRAGADAVETNTFGASPFRLSEYDFSKLDLGNFGDTPEGLDLHAATHETIAYYMNKRSAEIAVAAREEHRADADYDGRPLFVVGSIGPSNRVLSKTKADLKVSTFDAVADNFYEQVLGLIDGGADVLLYETQQDILEVKAAVFGGRRALAERGADLPIIVQVTVDAFSKMQIFNTDIHAALVTVEGIGIDVFGINCSIGPDLMVNTVKTLSRYSKLPISVIPNAGLPVSENGHTVYKLTPKELANFAHSFVTEYGVNIVGGCCGTGPEHIQAVAAQVKGLVPKRRTPDTATYLSGPQEAVLVDGSDALIRVGERLNVRGSLKVREAIEREGDIDHDVLEQVVREQIVDLGLTIIDVCMDSNLVDTTETLTSVIREQTTDFAGAMSIDSFSVESLAEAVKVYPGRPLINSMSLEEVEPGLSKIEAVIRATAGHHPMYVGLCAGPNGPAATREDKRALAQEIVDTAGDLGVTPDQIFIDMNVFPLGSESDSELNFALESLESIQMIKAIHPDLQTICGVGNLTNGLAKKPYMRKVLTSVYLDEARKHGLDAAIVNPNHYVFVEDLEAKDYELARKAILERDMDAFEELEVVAEGKKGKVIVRRTSYDDLNTEDAICQKIIDGYKERTEGSVEVGGHAYAYTDKIVVQAAEAIQHHEPLTFINDYLMVAMQTLGDGFGRGEVSLPHLLKSADVMKQVMSFIEEYMRVKSGADIHQEIDYKGIIVLGTVYQDVHSIGKDLAKTLFENYGYRVVDLGVMTPLQSYIDAAKEHNADAIGMSALLVQTSNHMIAVSQMMLEQNLEGTTVLVGGAPVNDRHAAYVAMAGHESESDMRSNVFYCATAMDGVNVMNELLADAGRDALLERNRKRLQERLKRAQRKAEQDANLIQTLPRRVISFDKHALSEGRVFAPERVSENLVAFRPRINRRSLFSLNWRFGGTSARSKHGTSDKDLERLFLEWTERADSEGWLLPQGVIAAFPCYSQGEEVVVCDIDNPEKELGRFKFDVVIGAAREDLVSGAQYFRPKDAGQLDVLGLQIASTGPQIGAQLLKFKQSGDTESALYLQGLSDRLAEDMAEHLHNALRERVGVEGANVGVRWSPGYPAIRDTEQNKLIHRLLEAAEKIGVSVTDAGEFSPTGCTAALISFHPDAKYT